MSLLSDYEQRTVWKYEPINGRFHTHDGLTQKVSPDGNCILFPGSTVVFRAGGTCCQMIQLLQSVLYNKLEDTGMLASLLPVSTIHMTLHDLVSPEQYPYMPGIEYMQKLNESLNRADEIVEEIRQEYAGTKITMVSDRIVNMLSKSLVMLLKPATEADYQVLMKLYTRFDAVEKLPYHWIPHITLAYFKPGMLDGDRLGRVVDDVQIAPENALSFDFYTEGLTAQYFLDMQTYKDVPERLCFCCDGGLDRSVMAANILNHMAGNRNLPVTGEARSDWPDGGVHPVSKQVWTTLERHGIVPDRTCSAASSLREEEISHFSNFVAISDRAIERFSWLQLPETRVYTVSHFFYGVQDPEYGEISYEEAFCDITNRVRRYLDFFANEWRMMSA